MIDLGGNQEGTRRLRGEARQGGKEDKSVSAKSKQAAPPAWGLCETLDLSAPG